MIASEPVLNVLFYSTLAAAVAALGALPFVRGGGPRPAWVGGASALAGGLMLGAGYLLMERGLDGGIWTTVAGGAAGVLYTLGARFFAGLGRLQVPPRFAEESVEAATEESSDIPSEAPTGTDREPISLVLLQHGLHSAAEGVAIGVAMTLNLRLGVFVALGLAVHNIAEALALSDLLVGRGTSPGRAAGLAVAINLPQPVLALAAFALGPVLAGLLPASLGFAAGALTFLVLTELIPDAYTQTVKGTVALVVSATAGTVILLESFFLGG